jgi:hypothetical protein
LVFPSLLLASIGSGRRTAFSPLPPFNVFHMPRRNMSDNTVADEAETEILDAYSNAIISVSPIPTSPSWMGQGSLQGALATANQFFRWRGERTCLTEYHPLCTIHTCHAVLGALVVRIVAYCLPQPLPMNLCLCDFVFSSCARANARARACVIARTIQTGGKQSRLIRGGHRCAVDTRRGCGIGRLLCA